MSIQAIETRYAGCRFRSRLEARWAVFFDHLSIRWEYEPQGFQFDGLAYLPDFHLPNQATFPGEAWIEIKPRGGSDAFHRFAQTIQPTMAYLLSGDIPNPDSLRCGVGMFGPICDYAERERPDSLHIEVFGDHQYAWCTCKTGKHIGLQFAARGERIPCVCQVPNSRIKDEYYTGNHPRLLAAYQAARSARFEHGEAG